MRLDHVTIRTRDIPATSAFFEQVFDLTVGTRPSAFLFIPGLWLYSCGHPIVHVIDASGDAADASPEAIDHVGFRLEGYAAFRAKLDQLQIPYSLQDLAEIGERRIFLRAPGGPLLEAVFGEPIDSLPGAGRGAPDA